MLPASTLWGMVQDAGAQLASAVEAKATAEVEAAQLRAELDRVQRHHAAELERVTGVLGRELEKANEREDKLRQALIAGVGFRWPWEPRHTLLELPRSSSE